MSENKRISNLYQSIYNGNPWLEVTLSHTLENVTAEQAYRKVNPNLNTIWEIVNHLIQWRRNILRRVQGETVVAPDHNYFVPILDSSEAAWEQSLQSLAKSQELWNAFFEDFNDSDLEKIYVDNNHTYYEHIHGIIQHDVYHLGQIVILKKLL
ncbi:MAG: DinB family protein [Flavobacterium circumlabens]|uniref:Damage-inducible protein DinB n=1 Tax=Flavobacterium circumlabens TaxID=2133765 RepID=A0A4Y7UC36_9FLAO|nr:DinB family protein [Flavobacterium circumlabens]TCN58586.1 putative damage-inducible protein DinB [Flavobacterium circumlabens]TEB44017.1 DinB family protein [Flavobacterium circumlabens]